MKIKNFNITAFATIFTNSIVSAQNCPVSCFCEILGSTNLVKCHAQNLTEIPDGIPSGTTVLDLTDNQIEHLDFGKLASLNKLRDLYVSKNHLQTVDVPESFIMPDSLGRLHLDYNFIQDDFVKAIFKGNSTNIYEMRLNGNYLTNLDFILNPSLSHLKRLDCEGNLLQGLVVKDQVFESNLVMEWLNVADNAIKSLVPIYESESEYGITRKMPSLQFLDLSKNVGLKAIDRQTFSVNNGLISLNFDGTGIEYFRDINMTSLETLQIRSDSLKTFYLGQFIDSISKNTVERFSLVIGGPNLLKIDLEGLSGESSKLDYLKEFTISELSDQADLDISEIISKMPSVKTVRVSNTGTAKLDYDFDMENVQFLQLHKTDVSKFASSHGDLKNSLKYLEVTECGIGAFGIGFLEQFVSLEVLDIRGNDIKQISMGAMQNLHWINFSENPGLKSFDLSAVDSLHTVIGNDCGIEEVKLSEGLTVIELKGNGIERLEEGGFSDSVRWLEISENSFVCDCEDVGYQSWLAGEVDALGGYNYVCDSGVNAGEKIGYVDFSYCEVETTLKPETTELVTTKPDTTAEPKTESSSDLIKLSAATFLTLFFVLF